MAAATDARLWYWTDYNRRLINQPQVLVTDFWSRFLTGVVAVCLTLISPYTVKIVRSFFLWVFGSREYKEEHAPSLNGGTEHHATAPSEANNPSGEPFGNDSVSEETALMPYQERLRERSQSSRTPEHDRARSNYQNAEEAHGLLHMLSQSESSRDFLWRCLLYVHNGGHQRIGAIVVIIVGLFAVFVAWAFVGGLSANIASDKTGLSASQHCGIWQFDDNAGDEAAYRYDLYNRQKEERASQYARNCYNNPNPTDTLSCRIFYNQSIGFKTKTQQICPFSAPELCYDGLYSAISFDTGLVDANTIGINSPVTYKFRRRTSCSPLNMSDTYITRRSEGSDDTGYYYNYGSLDDADYTYNTSRDPFEWLVPVYSANAEFSSLYPDQDHWQPISGLKRPNDSTLTIIFVSSLHIFHIQPSYDPIFPAHKRRPFEGSYQDYFYNSDPRARPLACVDTSEVCSAEGRQCWAMRDVLPPDIRSDPALWLMKWSLESSNIYDSIAWRLGAGLLAQEKVSQFISTPLAPNQWEIEASQLFAASLARIQYDAWGIATGEDRERPGYVEVTPVEGRGRLCGLYKFKTADYTNVNLIAFLGFIILAFAIYVFSWDLPLKRQWNTDSNKLVIGTVLIGVGSLVKAFGAGISYALKWVMAKYRNESHEPTAWTADTTSHNS